MTNPCDKCKRKPNCPKVCYPRKEYKYKSPITFYDQLENMKGDISQLLEKAANAVDDAIVYSVQHDLAIKVDRTELLRALMYDRKQYEKGYDDGYRDGTADVEPVRHAHWIKTPVDFERSWLCYEKCSNCGCHSSTSRNYCPDCGAKMDGKESEE